MRAGGSPDRETDQWRVYRYVVECMQAKRYLRLMVQASAGTGKSFLLTTIYLYCIVHGYHCRAAAPTGIAASNIEDLQCSKRTIVNKNKLCEQPAVFDIKLYKLRAACHLAFRFHAR